MNVTAFDYETPWSIPVKWNKIEDKETESKLLGYRVSFQAILAGDEAIQGPVLNVTVRRETLAIELRGLDSYTQYKISISAFTRFASGPPSTIVGGT